jgi:hypothetical protein
VRPWPASPALGLVVVGVAAVLLLSMGGAIVAAPVTVPLLGLVGRRHPRGAVRWVAVVLAAATVGEVAWALTYLTLGEVQPGIWLVPLGAAVGTGVLVVAPWRGRRAR